MLLSVTPLLAAQESVLYSFQDGSDSASPQSSLITDKAGNLYGTTEGLAGTYITQWGTVFELSPPATPGGAWTQNVLYAFTGAADGGGPRGSLIFDDAGNLFGTAGGGGAFGKYGVVFELSPPAVSGDAWTETVLYSFNGDDGYNPQAGLIFDARGNLYGNTLWGGTYNLGTAFRLERPSHSGGAWTETVLHDFGGVANGAPDGFWPTGPLVFGRQSVLYGTTEWGGTANEFCGDGCGVVFQLTPPSDGKGPWTETILHNFPGIDDGALLYSGVILDKAGNLYGTAFETELGGGRVFELSPPTVAGDAWTETVLFQFDDSQGSESGNPQGAVIFDNEGNLYGTTDDGGAYYYGTVYRLSPPATPGAPWTFKLLHPFHNTTDGRYPQSSLVFGAGGRLYGTTPAGGNSEACNGYGCGTVFTVVP